MKRYLFNLLIGIDQMANVVFGGMPDETISSRWGRNEKPNWFVRQGKGFLNWLDPDHCEDSIEFDEHGNPDPHHLRRNGNNKG